MHSYSSFFKKPILLFILVLLCIATTLLAISAGPDKKIKVALFLDKGAHPRDNLRLSLAAAPDMTLKMIDGEELRHGHLRDFDVVVVPGGSAKVESISMKAEGREEVRQFVEKGGLYLGICAGCYLLTDAKSSDLGLLPLDTVDKAHWRRGKSILPVELTALGKEICGTDQTIVDILYHNGPVIDVSHVTPGSDFKILGYFKSELVAHGGKPGLMVNSPAVFIGKFGKGLVLGISPHPEASETEVNMELNAIRWMYTHRQAP